MISTHSCRKQKTEGTRGTGNSLHLSTEIAGENALKKNTVAGAQKNLAISRSKRRWGKSRGSKKRKWGLGQSRVKGKKSFFSAGGKGRGYARVGREERKESASQNLSGDGKETGCSGQRGAGGGGRFAQEKTNSLNF